jgi:hypothetical protein
MQSFLQNRGSDGVKNLTENKVPIIKNICIVAGQTQNKSETSETEMFLLQNENHLQKGRRDLDSCLQCDKKQIIYNAMIANKSKNT